MRMLAVFAVLLSGCVTVEDEPTVAQSSPQSLMAEVATQVQACWFRSKDKRFAKYTLSPELNSYAGRPRILLVPRGRQSALPVLVAQAERVNGQTVFSSYGPLVGQTGGAALQGDLSRWASGERTC